MLEVLTGFEPVTNNRVAAGRVEPLRHNTISETMARIELAFSICKRFQSRELFVS